MNQSKTGIAKTQAPTFVEELTNTTSKKSIREKMTVAISTDFHGNPNNKHFQIRFVVLLELKVNKTY